MITATVEHHFFRQSADLLGLAVFTKGRVACLYRFESDYLVSDDCYDPHGDSV